MNSTILSMIQNMSATQSSTYYASVGSIGQQPSYGSADLENVVVKLVKTSSSSTSSSFAVYFGLSPTVVNGTTDSADATTSWVAPNFISESIEGNTFNLPIAAATENSGLWGPWTSAWPQTVSYPTSYSKGSLQTVEANAQTYRGEVNAQLQLYLQSTQARQSTIETSMKNMQNLVSQTTQAATNQMNLLDSIIQTMTSILSALFH